MNIMQRLGGGIVALCLTTVAYAAVPAEYCDATAPVDKKVVFVNGVQVEDETTALASLHRMETILCASANHAAVKRNFSFDLVYNPIGWTTVPNDSKDGTLLQDVMEVFVLKAAEEVYGDDMRSLQIKDAAPQSIDPYTYRETAQRIYTATQNLTSGITSLEQAPSVVTDFTTVCDEYGYCTTVTTASRPLGENDMAPTKNAITTLVNMIASGRVILVAHSEGNLLAHLAYAYAVDSDVTRKDNIRVVNIANTAQFSLNDFDLTHDSDTVIGALRQEPTLKGWSRNTTKYPGWNSHDVDVDVEDFSGASSFSDCPATRDVLVDHSLSCTYLSGDRATTVIDSRGVNYTPGKNTFADRFEDLVYTAASSLDAAQSGGWKTFISDDFNGAAVDADKWQMTNSDTPEDGGSLHFKVGAYGGAGIGAKNYLYPISYDPNGYNPVSGAVRIQTRFYIPPNSVGAPQIFWFYVQGTGYDNDFFVFNNTSDGVIQSVASSSGGYYNPAYPLTSGSIAGKWVTVTVTHDFSAQKLTGSISVDGDAQSYTVSVDAPVNLGSSPPALRFAFGGGGAPGTTVDIDYVKVTYK